MANGGTTGDDLERLQVQVDATRTELGEVAGAVSGLTELVTDLIRRSASNTDHQGDRWQARLGSLETRLEMLETAIRVEVERIRGAAGAVDALADDFKSTVGGTHNLVDLAANISDRLASLETLERGYEERRKMSPPRSRPASIARLRIVTSATSPSPIASAACSNASTNWPQRPASNRRRAPASTTSTGPSRTLKRLSRHWAPVSMGSRM